MSNVKKTLQMTSLLFGMVTLFCYIAWTLGYEGFIIVGNVDIPMWALHIIQPILLCVNLSLYAGFVLNIYSWKVLYFSIPMCILSKIGVYLLFLPAELFTGPIPAIIFILFILLYRLGLDGLKRLLILNLSVISWQWLTSKFSMIPLTVHVSVYEGFRLSISAILLMVLLYSIGGAKNDGRLERLVFPGFPRDFKDGNESRQTNPQDAESIPLDKFEKWVMRSVIGVVQVIQWMFILWVCNLDNLFLDALVMTTSFICHGMIINKRRHLKPIVLCTLAATAMFYCAARFTISFQYSQFFPIVIGLLLTYALYYVSYQFELAAKNRLQKDLERIDALEKEMANAWKQLDDLS